MKRYILETVYDDRQSFYNKARVEEEGNKSTLFSYEVPVAKIEDGNVTLSPSWSYSNTTIRHVREFLRQEGKLPTTIEGAEKSTIASLFPIREF